jgi:hypothetical protein
VFPTETVSLVSVHAHPVAPRGVYISASSLSKPGTTAEAPDETFEMIFAKDNAAEEGFNRWTINGVAYPMSSLTMPTGK